MAPTRPETPPTVLILGGTTTVARALVSYLLDTSDTKASYVRLADRFSVSPPTTYLDPVFLSFLNQPEPDRKLEYKQVNLGNVETHQEVMTLPSERRLPLDGAGVGRGFDIVFDLTGDTSFDKPELLQISNTYKVSHSLSLSASLLPPSLKPKSWVRLTFPFYEMSSSSAVTTSSGHKEGDELRPDGARGRWWHEVLRGLGTLARKEADGLDGGLRVGVIRCGAWYGRGTWDGEIIPRVVAGHVYQYLNEEMKFLYNSDLQINTVHTTDISQALYLLSLHILQQTYTSLLASAPLIPYTFTPPPSSSSSTFSLGKDKSKEKRASISDLYKSVSSVVPPTENVRLPLFNVVDENDSTQGSLARVVAETWGIKYGFLNSTVASLVQQFAKVDFGEMVEDVNEMHVQAWSDMLSKSSPPIESTAITPFLDEHAFKKHATCLNGTLAKTVLGFKAKYPRVEVEEIKEIVRGLQEDKLWPKLS